MEQVCEGFSCQVPVDKIKEFKSFCLENQIIIKDKVADNDCFDKVSVTKIAISMVEWLHKHKISQAKFAEDILGRKQGTLSDMLRVRVVPKSASGIAAWRKMEDFLNDDVGKEEFVNACHQICKKRKDLVLIQYIYMMCCHKINVLFISSQHFRFWRVYITSYFYKTL